MIIDEKNLRMFREKAFLSQVDLAAKIKSNRSVISQYEMGGKAASFKRVRELARVLKCRPEDLVRQEE